MATVEYGCVEGPRYAEDPTTGAVSYVLAAYVKDLAPVAGSFGSAGEELALISEAMVMMPARGSAGPVANTVLLYREPVVDVEFPHDCLVRLHYGTPQLGQTNTVQIRGGTSLEQVETEFDATNLALPFAQREPISVRYNPDIDGPPGTGGTEQGGRVPLLLPRSTITYTRLNGYDPSAESAEYVGKVNSVTFKGNPPGTVLCLEITFESSDGGNHYSTSYSLMRDLGGFKQVARYTDPATGFPPKLSIAKVAGQNGIKEVTVQGSIDLNNLGL